MTTTKKRNIIIIAIVLAVAIVAGIVIKINYDKKIEQDRVIALQAQIKADEEKKAAEEKEAAEKKAAEEKEEAAKKAAEEKAAAEKALKEALEKKKQEEASSSKPSGGGSGTTSKPSGGGTTSKPSDGGSSITSPGDKGDTGGGGWKDLPGNISNELKQEWYNRAKDYIGKSEPGTGHEVRDKIYGLMNDGLYVQIEWNSKLGVWEVQNDLGQWKLIDPITGGSMPYEGFGLSQRQ